MARMLQALKNLEAKEARPQTNGAAAAPPAAAVAAKGAGVATASANPSSATAVAPRIIDVVDKLDAVLGQELHGVALPTSAPAFSPTSDFPLTNFPFFEQPKPGTIPFPTLATTPQTQPEANTTIAAAAIKAPCELERQVKRALNNPLRSQPVFDLVDRLIRDMDQTESKVLAFVGLGSSADSHLPIFQAAIVLAEKRSKRVLLIDGDLSRHALSDGLEYGRCPGLGELCLDKAAIASVCQVTATKQVSFMPAGQMQLPNDSAAEETLDKALAQLKTKFDCILIDTGGAANDLATALAQASDAAYLVVELGVVETNTAQAALARLRAAGARVLGCIAT